MQMKHIKNLENEANDMSENISINKTTLLLVAGLLAVVLGLFFLFGNAPLSVTNGSPATENPVQGTGNGQQAQTGNVNPETNSGSGVQEVSIRALSSGLYDKQEVTVKKGIPVKLTFSADPYSGCGRMFVMRQFGVQLLSRNGEAQSATFTPTEEGIYEYSCSMRMFVGRMRVVS